ncbi:hypothetical protein ACIPK5_19585 [Streptomyces sp. NPDC086843]|uniref:hypothetical protein n=1 Tax=Streptomyces sp. NPDC086843 TaxID=3365763 RepID=UPI00381FA10F
MVTLDKPMSSADISDTALALLDDDGTVIGWTREARRLTGLAPGDAVGRAAGLVFPGLASGRETPGDADACGSGDSRPGRAEARHLDGRLLDVTLRVSPVGGLRGAVSRLVSLAGTAALPEGPRGAAVGPARLAGDPVGVVVRDTELRCLWANDTVEDHDGMTSPFSSPVRAPSVRAGRPPGPWTATRGPSVPPGSSRHGSWGSGVWTASSTPRNCSSANWSPTPSATATGRGRSVCGSCATRC